MDAADLDVGVIYTHERALMPPLLSTLLPSAGNLRLRLLLVDNASADGAEQWLGYVPQTEILRNASRLGYAANLNQVIRRATARYVLALNTDVYFDPREECLARMVGFMDRQADCGLAGCRVYHPDGRYGWPARRFQTLRSIAARRAGLAPLFRGALCHYLYSERSPFDTFDCQWLSGCFLLARRRALADTGPFDDGFPKYFEDVDLCLRMARAGWRVMFHGETHYFHAEQRASKRLLSRDAWLHLRSYLRWLRKWGLRPHAGLDGPATSRFPETPNGSAAAAGRPTGEGHGGRLRRAA